MTELRKSVPPNVAAATAKALEKLPADRFESAKAFGEALHNPVFAESRVVEPLAVQQRILPVIGLLSLGLAAGALAAAWILSAGDVADAVPLYLPLSPPAGVEFTDKFGVPMLVISPDGRRLVYAGTSTGVRRLYLQDLETRAGAEPIPGTDGAAAPFFSPDGGSLGFIAANLLQVVSLSGGEPRRLAPSPLFGGGTWTPDGDTIYYVPDVESGIWKVPAAGGTPTPVTRPLNEVALLVVSGRQPVGIRATEPGNRQ